MSEPRMFTEQEHLAVLADRVAKETASLSESMESLKSEKAGLETKLDVVEAAKIAAETAAETAKKELEDFKASLEADKAAAAKKDERLVAVKAAAAHLPEEYFSNEERVARIVAMSDEAFAAYAADLGATNVAPTAPANGEIKETAMEGSPVAPPAGAETPTHAAAASAFLMGHLITTEGGK